MNQQNIKINFCEQCKRVLPEAAACLCLTTTESPPKPSPSMEQVNLDIAEFMGVTLVKRSGFLFLGSYDEPESPYTDSLDALLPVFARLEVYNIGHSLAFGNGLGTIFLEYTERRNGQFTNKKIYRRHHSICGAIALACWGIIKNET